MIGWLPECYVLATSQVISGRVLTCAMRTHGGFIYSAAYLEIRPPAPWPDIPLSPIILTLNEPIIALFYLYRVSG